MISLILFTCAVFLGTVIYLKGVYNERYWKKRGIAFYKSNKVIGPFWEFMTGDRALFQIFDDIYEDNPNENVVAFGSLFSPALYVKDPININHIVQGDFNTFNHKGVEPFKHDKLTNFIVLQYGSRWRVVRQKISPIFTSAKLKNMYYIIDKSAKDFVDYLKKNPEKQKAGAFDTLSTFCSAAIGAAVFGLNSGSVFDSPYYTMASNALKPTFVNNMKFSIAFLSMPLVNFFRINLFGKYENFFVSTIRQVIKERKEENVKRHDFVDLCVSIQKNGTMKDSDTNYELEPTVELLAAQAFFFFLAGVEPTASAAYALLLELGRNPTYLNKVHEEIDEAFKKYNAEFNFEAINGLVELDKALNEALRMHPPVGFMTRQSVRDTILPNGNIKVAKGTKIFLPIYEVHHDPKYYPNPDVFDPERFAVGGDVNKDMFMPFGKGNRICIGARYAQLQAKAGLVHLLRNFTVKTHIGKNGLKYSKQQIQVRPDNVDIEFIPRDKEC